MDEDELEDLIQQDSGQMRADGMDETTQGMVDAGKNGVSRAGRYAKDKAYDKAYNAWQKRKIKDKPRTLPPGKKLKAEKLKAKGAKDKALGTAKEGTGRAMQGAGKTAKAAAVTAKAAVDVAATVADAAFGAGEAIRAAAKPVIESVKNAGENLDETGKEIAKGGKQQKAAGKDALERAKSIETTGHDKGPSVPESNVEIPKSIPIPGKIDIKSIIKMSKKKVSPVVIIALIAIIVLILAILLFVFMLQSDTNDGKYEEGNNSNVPYVVTSKYLQSLTIVLNEDGEYEFQCMDDDGNMLTTDEALTLVLKTLKENDCKAYDTLGSTDAERKEFLKLLIQAEIATQYPDISGGEYKNEVKKKNDSLVVGDKLSSNIQVSRKDEDGKTIQLSYIDEKSFNDLITAKDDSVMKYYTIKKNITRATGQSPSTLTGSDAEEQIWNFLIDTGLSESGAAGLMGNFRAESACQSVRVQNTSYENSIIYTEKVDSGEISEYDFVHNGPGGGGYGLAQWTSEGRKQNLYTFAKSKGKSIGDLQMQLEFAEHEIQTGYPYIWSQLCSSNNTISVCDLILENYEIPAVFNYGDRRGAATEIYQTYKGTRTAGSSSSSNTSSTSSNKNSGNSSSAGQNSSSASQNVTSSVASFDKFLFIGDSRYVGIEKELKELGSGINVCAVESSSPSDWKEVINSGAGNVLRKFVAIPEESAVSNISVMLGVNSPGQTSYLEELFEKLHTRYPRATIYYTSTYHIGTDYKGVVTNASIDTLNGTIREYSEGKDWFKYVDTNSGLHDENGYLMYSSDGLHITSSEGKSILVNNIKNGILGSGVSSTASSSANSNTNGGYGLVVANKSTQNVNTVVSHDEFMYSEVVSTVSGSIGPGTRFSETPASEVTENTTTVTYTPTCVAYQDALKEHTLYFDFLWAVFIDTKDKTLVENWAKIAIESSIDVTVFNDENVSVNVTTQDGAPKKIYKLEDTTSYEDTYNTLSTTTTTTTTVTSKLGVTKADTWLMEYLNEANTYAEYQAKADETIREKTEKDDDIMKILRKNQNRLSSMHDGVYRIERMIGENPKVDFMLDIYEYITDKALNGKKSKYKTLSDFVDAKNFDLNTFTASFGRATGDGSLGGDEIDVSGEGYNNIFKVGTRTYINYKQLQGPWYNDSLAGFPDSCLGPAGCAINSIAVILSGYGINMTPRQVNDYAKSTATPTCHGITLGTLLNKKVDYYDSGNMPELVLQQLNSGKPCMVWSNAYSESHFFCILAISEDGNYVYVSDVGGDYPGRDRDGWQPLYVLDRVRSVYIIGD